VRVITLIPIAMAIEPRRPYENTPARKPTPIVR
jgi:hypothetical protein